jgi:hypothetical protein
MKVYDATRPNPLEDENFKFKRPRADTVLDDVVQKELLGKY